jgi:hypothetical protein
MRRPFGCGTPVFCQVSADFGPVSNDGEWLLNVRYLLKEREGLLPAGHQVAQQQIVLKEYEKSSMELKNAAKVNTVIPDSEILDNNRALLTVKGENFSVEFDRRLDISCTMRLKVPICLKKAPQLRPTSGEPLLTMTLALTYS